MWKHSSFKCTAKTIAKLLCLICWLWKCSHAISLQILNETVHIFDWIFFLVMKLNINKNERISMKFNGIRWCLTCFNIKKNQIKTAWKTFHQEKSFKLKTHNTYTKTRSHGQWNDLLGKLREFFHLFVRYIWIGFISFKRRVSLTLVARVIENPCGILLYCVWFNLENGVQ